MPKKGASSVPFQTSTRTHQREAGPPVQREYREVLPTPVAASNLTRNPGLSQRLSFDLPEAATALVRLSPVRESMEDDLVAALTAFTTQMQVERHNTQLRTTQLMDALDQQRQQNDVLVGLLQAQHAQQAALPPAPVPGVVPVPQVAAQPRVSSIAVESIPRFEGGLKDYPQDFVDFVDRVAVSENWTDAQRIQVASRRLTRTALDWHIHTGHTFVNWADWSASFITNFSPRLHFSEWHRMVEERRQKPGESGIEYALDKHKLLRVSPMPLNNEQMVSFLIDGLARWQHVAAMTADTPANVTEFITRIRALETLGISSRPEAAPPTFYPSPAANPVPSGVPPPAAADFGACFSAFGDRLINELASQLDKLVVNRSGGGGMRGGTSAGRGRGGASGWVDPSARTCFHCNRVGHIARNCPSRSENGEAGR